MANDIVDTAYFQHCSECGDEITLEDTTKRDMNAKAIQLGENGWQCDRCEEGSTPFEKQVQHHLYQWLGPVEYREKVLSVIEPQNATYAVVALRDGRSAKVFRYGESERQLGAEVPYVIGREFPDLNPSPSPAARQRANI